jgi:hypothetical protein
MYGSLASLRETCYLRISNDCGVQKSVGNHVIEPQGPSQFHSFVPIAPTLHGNSTNMWIRFIVFKPRRRRFYASRSLMFQLGALHGRNLRTN